MSDTQEILKAIDKLDRKNDEGHRVITAKLELHTEKIHENDKEIAKVKTSWKIVSAVLGGAMAIGLTLIKVLA